MNTLKINSLFIRRDHDRIRTDAQTILYLRKSIKKELRLKNISARGLLGLTDSPIPTGEKVEVLLFYPFSHELIKKEATVVWCKPRNIDQWASGLDFGSDNKLDLASYYDQTRLQVDHNLVDTII